ncbi:MAG: phosphotransferase family protein [Nevskia sp.]|nr:phosphotransferase family protein [Nevskia sp.]
MSAMQPAELAARLRPLIEKECGAGSQAANVGVMEDGHAGLTFGFDVVDAGGRNIGSYVIKLAPRGVTRRGNTDVYRQAPLLRALKAAGLPVPAVPWASPDEDLLGTPFIVMEKLPGRVFLVWEPHAVFKRDTESVRDIWLQTARLLARFHQVDAATVLRGWEQPRGLPEELAIWPNVIKHAQDPAWLAAGTALGEQLRARMPDGQPVGLIHGDYQPGNILFENGRVSGVIDWELSFIGAQGLDLGWLMMMSDPAAWDASFPPTAPPSQAELVDAYRAAGGPAWRDVGWYQAMAQYRMGSIACLNVKLHRTGKRHDPLWERFAPSIATLFSRGSELVA